MAGLNAAMANCPHRTHMLAPFRAGEDSHKAMILGHLTGTAMHLFEVYGNTYGKEVMGVEVPHAFVQLHKTASVMCMNHNWHNFLLHQVCGIILDHRDNWNSTCIGSDDGVPNSGMCHCAGFDKVVRDCSHNVVPWATTHLHTEDVATGNACDAMERMCYSPTRGGSFTRAWHPILGLCRYFKHRRALKAPRRHRILTATSQRFPKLRQSIPKQHWKRHATDQKMKEALHRNRQDVHQRKFAKKNRRRKTLATTTK